MDEDKIIDEEVLEEDGLNDKLKKLRAELKECEKQKAEYLAGWQRAKADFINARKDEEKARGEFAKFATERVLVEMLAVADSLELSNGADSKPIYNQLMDILKKEGVLPIEALGKKFNPLEHEALEQVEVDDKEKDSVIVEELQKGYTIY